MYFDFLYNFSEIYHSDKNWVKYDQQCTLVFMLCTHYSCQILMKLESSGQIFEKYSNTKFHENPSSGSRVVPCDGTDRRTERWADRQVGWQTDSRQTEGRRGMSNLIVTFRNFANTLQNWQEVNIKFLVTVKINVVQTLNLWHETDKTPCQQLTCPKGTRGYAMAQAVSGQPLTE